MKTYCSICYAFKQMYKRGLAYRGYTGFWGGVVDQARYFRTLHRKTHNKEAASGFKKLGP